MKALTKGLMTIALLAATTACDGSPTTASAFVSENDGIAMARQSRLTFNSTQSHTTGNEQTASGGAGAIEFTGTVTTGTPCYDVSATHQEGAGSVTVTVTATSTGQICTQVITFNNYNGRVSRLSAGTYDFTVIHNVNGSSSTAFTGTVTVR
ncbi:MAG TPA: hypothetical protein VHG93_14190 [Longimicrobium sp.]|nr:hypothetical protein [Longimicrobium sp.]